MNPRFARTSRLPRGLVGGLLGAAAAALLLYNTAEGRAETDYKKLSSHRRLWEDLAIGITRYVESQAPSTQDGNLLHPAEVEEIYHHLVASRTRREEIRPWEFWRTLHGKAFLKNRSGLLIPKINDPGRAILLAWGFRLLGGVSPYLILWLGVFFCAPVLVWIAWEFAEARLSVAGAVFVFLVASSPFAVETLSLPRSAVGFYLVALLVLVALSVFGTVGAFGTPGVNPGVPDFSRSLRDRGARPAPLLARSFAAGIVFAVCALCRSGCLFLLPGFALALWLGARRVPRRGAAFAAALALLLLPYAIVRQPQYHDAWQSIWEGLGDFDRTKGHCWSDAEALKVIMASGGRELRSPESEEILRGVVLRHVAEDPLWFGGILARRTFATLTQAKLAPWGPRDGMSMSPGTSPNEGAMDKYYRYTTTVDFLGFGRRRIEMPLSFLLAPPFALLLLPLAARRWPSLAKEPERHAAFRLVLLCVAVASLAVPVLISTAGGQDTQAFALVYFLGFSFLIDQVARWAWPRGRPRAPGAI